MEIQEYRNKTADTALSNMETVRREHETASQEDYQERVSKIALLALQLAHV